VGVVDLDGWVDSVTNRDEIAVADIPLFSMSASDQPLAV
jgi:hypothetical protein